MRMSRSSPTTTPRRRRIGHLAGLAVFLVLVVLWLLYTRDHPATINRDWVAFDNAGWRALSGDWASIYRRSADERWPYLYPPFAIPLAIPLGLVPYWWSYLLAVVMTVGGVAWASRRIGEVTGPQEGRRAVFFTTLLCAPTTLQVIITGQYSWLYLVSLSGLAAGLHRGDHRTAGRSLALLAVKPNLALLVGPLLLVRRQWKVVGAAAWAVTAVVLITMPLSMSAWSEFTAAVRGVAERQEQGDAPVNKQVTILAFVRTVSGHAGGSPGTWLVWAAVAAVLAALVVRTWHLADGETPSLRLVGLAALGLVALSPRLYFYDALVVGLPAAAWYLQRETYRSRWNRRLQGCCLAATVVATFVFFPAPGFATVVGPLTGAWLALEAIDLTAAAKARRSTTDDAAGPAGEDAPFALAS